MEDRFSVLYHHCIVFFGDTSRRCTTMDITASSIVSFSYKAHARRICVSDGPISELGLSRSRRIKRQDMEWYP